MDPSVQDKIAEPQSAVFGLLLVAVFLFWTSIKRMTAVRDFERNHLWGFAVVDFVVLPAAAFGLGQLLGKALGAIGLGAAERFATNVTELLVALGLAAGVARVIEVWLLEQNRTGRRRKLSALARSALFGVCLLVGLLVFLIANDYAPTELYVSTGAAAAILAFAMQQTLGDLFSGIALSIERPFEIGDWLRFSDGMEGEVTDINWRATRLRGWDNTTFIVPNGQLAHQSFTNLHGPDHLFAPWYFVRVTGEADPRTVKDLLEAAAARCDSILPEPAPVARLTDGATVPYTYMVWVHFPNYPSMFAGREDLYREIRAALLQAGLQLAAEIQEVRFRPMDAEVDAGKPGGT